MKTKKTITHARFKLRKYRCNKCGKEFLRGSNKLWLNTFCEETGKNARFYRVRKQTNKPTGKET